MNWKNKVEYIGHAISAMAIMAIAYYLVRNFESLPTIPATRDSIFFLAGSLFIYILAAIPSSASWHTLTRRLLPHWTILMSFSVWSVAQIGKYLPGNVAHHLARLAIIGGDRQITGRAAAVQFIEVFMAIPSAALCSLLLFSLSDQPLNHAGFLYSSVIFILSILVLLFLPLVSRLMRWQAAHEIFEQYGAQKLAGCLALQIVALLFASISFSLCAYALIPAINVNPFTLTACFPLSWLAGYVVIGAPAGAGVREGALVIFLSPGIQTEQIIAICILHRILALVGDSILFLLGLALKITKEKCHA